MVPSSGKEQQCGSDAKLSRPRVVVTHTCVQRAHKGMSQRTGRSIRDQRCKELTPLLDGFSTMEAFLGPKAQLLSIRLAIQLIEQDIKKLSTANQFNCSVTRFVAANDRA